MIERFFSPAMRMQRYGVSVLLPTLLVSLYAGLLASDGYISRASFLIEQETTPSMAGAEVALSLLNLGTGPSRQDTLIIQAFFNSRNLLEQLQQSLDLRAHFSSHERDLVTRLDDDASNDEFLDYYMDHLHTEVDEESKIMTIHFTAYDALFAQHVVAELVSRGEDFVNQVNQRLAEEQLSFVAKEVDKAAKRLRVATSQMLVLQKRNDVLSPEKETEAFATILMELEAELSRQQTALKALSSYLTPTAPDIVAAKQRIEALQNQVAQERQRMVGGAREGYSELMLEYQDAEVNLRLAGELYKSALASLETTRLDAARKAKYLIPIDSPSLPQDPELPRVMYWTATVFVILNLVYFVTGLIVATIQDHRE